MHTCTVGTLTLYTHLYKAALLCPPKISLKESCHHALHIQYYLEFYHSDISAPSSNTLGHVLTNWNLLISPCFNTIKLFFSSPCSWTAVANLFGGSNRCSPVSTKVPQWTPTLCLLFKSIWHWTASSGFWWFGAWNHRSVGLSRKK